MSIFLGRTLFGSADLRKTIKKPVFMHPAFLLPPAGLNNGFCGVIIKVGVFCLFMRADMYFGNQRRFFMDRFRRFAAFLAALMFLFSAACAEEAEVAVDEIPLDGLFSDSGSAEPAAAEAEIFTPSYGSPWTEDLGSSYWTTPMDITDEETVWNMLMEPINVIDKGNVKNPTKQNIYIYKDPDAGSKIIGELTNLSQGVRIIRHLENGWSLVECYSSSFASKPATKTKAWNILVSGYIESKYLKQVKPTDKIALVVDKLAQRLYVFQEGKMVAELLCSTGLVQKNNDGKWQPYNETRSGEFLIINMTGALTSDRLICSFAMRFNAGDEIHEVPHQVDKRDNSKKYNTTEPSLGKKKSHGCIRVQRLPNPDGINMEWIYRFIRNNNLCGKVKIVIWEDWQGRRLPVPAGDTVLYYNPNKGQYYHTRETCKSAKKGIVFTPFLYSQLDEGSFAKLKPCDYCAPPRRESEIDAINAVYAPGEDHDPNLTRLRQDYYDYLAK